MKAENFNAKKLTAEFFYDGKTVLLSQETALVLGLDLKKELPDEMIPTLVEESEKFLCKKYLYDQIARYYKTRWGYFSKLMEKGYSKTAANYALDRAEESGYIDDRKFAENYVELNQKKKGAFRIKKELIAKGISSDIAADAVSNLETDREELYTLAKKLAKGDLNLPENRQKLYRKLASRGFSYGDIAFVTEQLKKEYSFDDFND